MIKARKTATVSLGEPRVSASEGHSASLASEDKMGQDIRTDPIETRPLSTCILGQSLH